ncbi:hypothetical protein AB3M83_00830 [Microbacterium sp. 179-B 1A2 NHS]|uniref:hypothetical protein n=1 Tax=Microbacterium sp. 179-B 1A2 NHS TaxID=3142383 RepID=UPI0039A2C8FE
MNPPPTTRRAARRARRTSRATRMVQGALGAALVTVLGILGGGGTFALWNSSAAAGAQATITAGTAQLALTGQAPAATGLYPGRTVYAVTTVSNTGSVPLALSLTATGAATEFTRALLITAAPTTSAADCTAGRVTDSRSAAVGTAADLGLSLAPGATRQLCLGVGLPADAPASTAGAATTALAFTLSGTQVVS